MNSAAIRVAMFLACILAGLAYGLTHELENPPNWVDWVLAGISVLGIAVTLWLFHDRLGLSPMLGVFLVPAMWAATVLGDFLPYALGLGQRALGDYGDDNWWQLLLIFNVLFFALLGLVAGLVSAALTGVLLRFSRLIGRVTGARQGQLGL